LAIAVPALQSRAKDKLSYGEGLIVNIPFPEAEVAQVVQEVAQNGIIRGTKEYNKDEYVGGAKATDSTRVFPAWTEGGKVFYKVRLQALDPRNFKDSGDLGTLAVRYIVKPQGDKNTVLRIDAVFVEDFRHTVHTSNGSVEGSEYKDIRDHIEAIEVMKQQTAETENERQQLLKKRVQSPNGDSAHATVPATATAAVANDGVGDTSDAARQLATEQIRQIPAGQTPTSQAPAVQTGPSQTGSSQSLEQHIQDLRRQVERLVKAPGAPLKSAPFHTASTLSPLATGTEVLILISTPYWYGVETRDGQHGWVFRDEVEPLP
jgi:polyhydroxyalkanoate synthesis regulator phasin